MSGKWLELVKEIAQHCADGGPSESGHSLLWAELPRHAQTGRLFCGQNPERDEARRGG